MLIVSMTPITFAAESEVTIKGGNFEMVPGEFSVLQYETSNDISITDVTWNVDKHNVVTVDEHTGRIDAIGTGTANIKLTAVDENSNTHNATATVTVSGGPTPIVEPIPELQNNNRLDFMMGADVSSLYQIMQENKKFYDLEGNESHLFDILEENGVNWVRLRVWNDPYDEFGNPLGGGNTTIDTTIELAKQAKERGMKVFTTFHYSDFWAHPGQQIVPKAWKGLSNDELAIAVGEFTTESLNKMKDAGVYPDMVGIGNETNSDILEIPFNLGNGNINPDAVEIFKAGAAAVRSTDPDADDPDNKTLVSFHLANGNNTWLYENFAQAMENNNVDYDALGASYYPSWHGTYDEVLNNLNNITDTYGKYAFIAETAYPWTINEDAGDDIPQNFKHGDVSTVGLAASVQGQATALREAINVAAKIDNEKGLGAFYWEPAWLPGPTTGWATPYGTGWEVANLFDINGYALPSIKTFELVRGDQTVPANANDYAYGWETTVQLVKGSTLNMPSEIIAVKNNGMMGDAKRTITRQPVVWNTEDIANVDVNTAGEYIVFGSLNGGEDNAFAHVIVKESENATAEAPTFSLASGSEVDAIEHGYSASVRHLVDGGGTIELATDTPNAQIAFTLDSAQPRQGLDQWGWPNGQVEGATRELAGAPYIKASDSIRVYSGPIQITHNVEINATTRRLGYNYQSGSWGSDETILGYSPVVSASYKAVYDYSDDLLKNGGFESGDLTDWTLISDASTAEVITPQDFVTHAYAGDHAFEFSLDAGQSLTLEQEVDVPNGVYNLSLFARGDNQTSDETVMGLTAESRGQEYTGDVKTFNVPGGEMIWRQYAVKHIEVRDGKLAIGFDAETSDSYTGYIDHIVLEATSGEIALADTEALEAAISAAESLDADMYKEAGYSTLQTAVQNATSLLQDSGALQSEIDAAVDAIHTAIEALELNLSKLEALIDTASAISNSEGNYTKASYQALQDAISVAETALGTIDSEQELKTALTDLQTAIDKLETIDPLNRIKEMIQDSALNIELGTANQTSFTKEEMRYLVDNNITIHLTKDSVQLTILSANFTGSDSVTIKVVNSSVDTPEGKALRGDMFDFTITEGSVDLTDFDDYPILLKFMIDSTTVSDEENLGIYYYDGSNGWAEQHGGVYADGAFTYPADHFSTYAVMETVEDSDDTGNEDGGESLPDTNIGSFTWMLWGLMFLLIGAATYFVKIRKMKVTKD